MTPESSLRRLRSDLSPRRGAKSDIKQSVMSRIAPTSERAVEALRTSLEPTRTQQKSIWQKVVSTYQTPATALEKIKEGFTLPEESRIVLWQQVLMRLSGRKHVSQSLVPGLTKWTAAVAILVLLVHSGPAFFLATPSQADSKVLLIPTRGEVQVAIGGFWQPVTEEIVLEPGMKLRTQDGEASILFHDDGVVRMDQETAIEIHDTFGRAIKTADFIPATMTLFAGRVWMQGLTPANLRPLSMRTTYGNIAVHEGSVSISEEDAVDIAVLDRKVIVSTAEAELHLISGERTRLSEAGELLVKKLPGSAFDRPWNTQNLARDAVHRRSIAQLQQERRAARAGILPTSPLYGMKRIAEKVDVILSLNDESRVQKKLNQANLRLDEAAALLAEGETEAVEVTLEKYQTSLVALAGQSDDAFVLSLIEDSLAEASGESAAVLPDSEAYLIKEAVLTASTLVDGEVTTADVQGVLLVDTASALLRAVDEGDIQSVGAIWESLSEPLALLDDETAGLSPVALKEAKVLLSEFAFALKDSEGVSDDLLAVADDLLPPEPANVVSVLSEEEVQATVAAIKERIFVYHMQRSRLNQLRLEFLALKGHPDQGRILRRLYYALPGGPEEFPERVRKEIVRLQWQLATQ